ncbi:cathepsin B-like [Homalodisca vitripennis]|nr:cathepsin B-like [Homalodisca vitripennis]
MLENTGPVEMLPTRCVLVLLLLVPWARSLDESNIHSEQFWQDINAAQDQWRAGRNFLPGSFVKNMLSVLPARHERLPQRTVDVNGNLPESFDGRVVWKRCKGVGKVRDQGNCASAWAMVASAVFTDRLCVTKGGNTEISAQNVLSCCKECGTNCYGGYVSDALVYLGKRGAPSYRCHPYEIYGCPKPGALDCPAVRALNPRCRTSCRSSYNKRPYQDVRRAGGAYSLANTTAVIQSELVARGPVAAVMDLYEDLLVYKSGVYSHTAGHLLAQHPVKIVGWGTQAGTPYWLVVNTWSPVWGDRGILRVAINTNGCHLENRVFALNP